MELRQRRRFLLFLRVPTFERGARAVGAVRGPRPIVVRTGFPPAILGPDFFFAAGLRGVRPFARLRAGLGADRIRFGAIRPLGLAAADFPAAIPVRLTLGFRLIFFLGLVTLRVLICLCGIEPRSGIEPDFTAYNTVQFPEHQGMRLNPVAGGGWLSPHPPPENGMSRSREHLP